MMEPAQSAAEPKGKKWVGDPHCLTCGGAGIYADPPRWQQEREVEQGLRKFLTQELCSCGRAVEGN